MHDSVTNQNYCFERLLYRFLTHLTSILLDRQCDALVLWMVGVVLVLVLVVMMVGRGS